MKKKREDKVRFGVSISPKADRRLTQLSTQTGGNRSMAIELLINQADPVLRLGRDVSRRPLG